MVYTDAFPREVNLDKKLEVTHPFSLCKSFACWSDETCRILRTSLHPKMRVRVGLSREKIDIPIHFQVNAKVWKNIQILLGDEDIDGFVELRPVDAQRASTAVFWEKGNPILYDARACVRATEAMMAYVRGTELFEHLADRFTIFAGTPVRVLAIGAVYNEDQLRECLAGTRTEYEMTLGGEYCFKTAQPFNGNFPNIFSPPKKVIEAMRWFRIAMESARETEKYLFYYIALESIAKHVPGVVRVARICQKCGDELGSETQENAAIKHLISRRSTLTPDALGLLKSIRARIAHGNSDAKTIWLAQANLPVIQRLAADGIALVLGIETDSLQFDPANRMDIRPIGVVQFSPENHHATSWGRLLSDAFAEFDMQRQSRGA